MFNKLLIIVFALMLFSGCKLSNERKREAPAPKATYPAFSFNRLYFGEGGGVTGRQQNYMLDSLGILYQLNERQDQKTRLDSVEHEVFRQIDAKVRDIRLLNEINQGAGNMNYHLVVEGAEFRKSYKWKKPGQEVPRLLEDLHAQLMKLASE